VLNISVSITTLVQHLLFFSLLVVAPLWDFYDTRRLKKHPGSQQKIRYYETLCAWLWISSVVACLAVGLRPLFTINPAPGEIPWLLLHAWVAYLVGAVIAVIVIFLSVLPIGIVIWKKVTNRPRKYSSADTPAVKSFSYFLPATRTERRWVAFLCITAGVCEETLFRGFLLHYLHVFPWTLNLTLALLVSSVIFGFGHLYGGASGVVGSAVVGFLLGLLFMLTGNLLLPMILHAITDLRFLVILPPADEPL
jgi:CAAX protease family protein